MPRKLVKQLENMTYHTWSRCIEWKPMMKEDYFKEVFLEVIYKTQKKYNFELNYFTVMDNHIHLVIKTLPGEATISRIMQYIKSRFAEIYNELTERIGPFWNERYKYSIIEESDDPENYLLLLLWYLAYNPVRKKFTEDPRNYYFSGINAYLVKDSVSVVKITLHNVFLNLGESFDDCSKALLEYEEFYRKRYSKV